MHEGERVPALDGVRGVAILMVVAMHSLYLAPAFGVPLEHPLARTLMLGWCGVDVFFVLSGLLITGILVRTRGDEHYFRNFYARRALRIFPLYYLVLVLLLWVLPRSPVTGAEQAAYLLYYQNIRFALFGQEFFDPARLVTWSLAIEEQFYLVWPAVVLLLPRRALVVASAAIVAFAIVLRWLLLEQAIPGVSVPGTHFLTPCRLDTLCAGALMALLPPLRQALAWLLAVGGAAGLVAVAATTGEAVPEAPAMQRWGLLLALPFGVGLVALARSSRPFARLMSARVLRSFGQYSYCIYLTHFLVVEVLTTHGWLALPAAARDALIGNVPGEALVLLFFALAAITSWGVGWLSWRLYERWFLRLKDRFQGRSGRGGAALRAAATRSGR
jgi:peptidoglycan/LPS O-acetylase OafA/YrhL